MRIDDDEFGGKLFCTNNTRGVESHYKEKIVITAQGKLLESVREGYYMTLIYLFLASAEIPLQRFYDLTVALKIKGTAKEIKKDDEEIEIQSNFQVFGTTLFSDL